MDLSINWQAVAGSLLEQGYAHQPAVILSAAECEHLRALNTEDALFRARIQMERFRFGVGSYGYFAEPLPELVSELRAAAYPHLAPVANEWMERLGLSKRYPDDLAAYLATCHEAGQTRPTPLLLHYRAGGYNCLHQDLYGEEAFPFQIVIQLSKPGEEFTGGEFLMVEQRPRAQSVGSAVQPGQGEMVVFTTRYRPIQGSRGYYRANVKHGVSRIHSGERFTLGIIFHDAA